MLKSAKMNDLRARDVQFEEIYTPSFTKLGRFNIAGPQTLLNKSFFS